jgi:hypothetical protein
MRLTTAQSEQLLEQHGIWIKVTCDRCGNLLGAVRWTRRGEPGEWCSGVCRDGVKAEHARKRGGRPRKYKTDALRIRSERQHSAVRQRAFRQRRGVTENPLQSNGTEGVADAFLSSGYTPSRTYIAPVLEALR